MMNSLQKEDSKNSGADTELPLHKHSWAETRIGYA
jgi:hypothetical protein